MSDHQTLAMNSWKGAIIILAIVGGVVTAAWLVNWTINYRPEQLASISHGSAVPTWEVRWIGRNGAYSANQFEKLKAFQSRSEADEFAEKLKAAYRLVDNTGDNKITVQESK